MSTQSTRDRERIVSRYYQDPCCLLEFLSGWIGAAGITEGLEAEVCSEIAEIIDECLDRYESPKNNG